MQESKSNIHKNPFEVPQGYFEARKVALKKIPTVKTAKRRLWVSIAATAACLVFIILITGKENTGPSSSDILASYLLEEGYLDYSTSELETYYLDYTANSTANDIEESIWLESIELETIYQYQLNN
ncbi:MAG: hypothetical protein ACI8ZO_000512 [Flavobacteriales bacterium]|jgi:hypothetical protein